MMRLSISCKQWNTNVKSMPNLLMQKAKVNKFIIDFKILIYELYKNESYEYAW